MQNGNTERFASIIADKWLIVMHKDTGERVYAWCNPHIADKLQENRCDTWRIDNIGLCVSSVQNLDNFTTAGTFVFDTRDGTFTRFIRPGAKVCVSCGEEITDDKCVGHMCHRCLTKSNGLAYRFGYHGYYDGYPVRERIDTKTTPVFGCEIERDYVSRYGSGDFDTDLKTAMLDACKILYEKDIDKRVPDRKAVFMSDGSLNRGGIEWITFPQSYQAYKKNKDVLQRTIDEMKSKGFKNSSSVGNHIHINADFFGTSTYARKYAGAKMALVFNAYWDELKAIAKRTDTGYCQKPNQQKGDDIYTVVMKTEHSTGDHSVAVNLQHNNTIELRLWSGIDSVDDLLFYLDMTKCIATYAKKKSVDTIQAGKFIDVLKYISDKDHYDEILKRLHAKGITRYDDDINKLKGAK